MTIGQTSVFFFNNDKPTEDRLPVLAQIYLWSLGIAALVVFTYALAVWQRPVRTTFVLYLVAGIGASRLKVWFPGSMSTLSVSFLFILTSAIECSLAGTVLMGASVGVTQVCLASRSKRPLAVRAFFSGASFALCGAASYGVYHAGWVSRNIPLGLLLSAVVFFVLNSSFVAGIITLTEGKSFVHLWRTNFLWLAPHYLVGGALAGLLRWCDLTFGWQGTVLVLPPIYLIYHSYRLHLDRLEEEKRHSAEMADLHFQTVRSLALAIDARDGTTHAHLRRVQVYAREVGRELGLSAQELSAIEAASLLHDIGKLAIPDSILSKPGKLTAEEFEIMKRHPVIGAEILEGVPFPYPVAPIVRSHHEKWNGTGYPDGLQGEQIPAGARIIAAVDCLDALASDRQYRRALPLDEAMRKVALESGAAFDPRVVEILGRRYVEFEAMARSQPEPPQVHSLNMLIEKGGGPAAGLEPSQPPTDSGPAISSGSEFYVLFGLVEKQAGSLTSEQALALLAAAIRSVIPFHSMAIYTVRASRLLTRYASGEDAELLLALKIPIGEGISGWVSQNALPIVNANPGVEPGLNNWHGSALSVPLPLSDGMIGVLTLYNHDPSAYHYEHLRMLQAKSGQICFLLESDSGDLKLAEPESNALTNLAEAIDSRSPSGRPETCPTTH